jgi:hypothetical protein
MVSFCLGVIESAIWIFAISRVMKYIAGGENVLTFSAGPSGLQRGRHRHYAGALDRFGHRARARDQPESRDSAERISAQRTIRCHAVQGKATRATSW